ncbi:diguanylate cyclase (GGDEF) domain-containing protein [Arthrobacter cupressi]|uniref:Diguanylate cyclase (GGDEF) domain-containing protein n=1 Tax=Arthrobacter cupressi TaxID=1045773 RepID=A0A1G8QWP3_9MICC|nr:GGDEF domain-containing protein [Arthrobacter cupressi]SDJ09162.1 diguanylate cyclase (GGDEF) domain-containing protein [Arthrobacter cupressi]
MELDTLSLRLVLGVVTVILCLLFYASYRQTRSAYSGWWCLSLVAFLAGNLVYLLTGTPHQVWADPLGNGLVVGGAFCVWAGARSLRLLPTPLWQVLAAPAITAVASALENPASNEWSGGLVYLALMAVGMGLATRELVLLEPRSSYINRSLALAAGVLTLFYACRWPVYLMEGPEGPGFRTFFSPAVTSLLIVGLLVTVSFSMTALSNEQLINGLNERANRDGLTGVLNRRAFMELAAREVHRMDSSGTASTLIMADLDHFKSLNDKHGHAAGDAAIQAFASACVASIRSTDLVGRYGGEEFLILLPGAEQETGEIIAGVISRALAAAPTPPGVVFPTVSYGVAASAIADADLPRMIKAADAALYEAKALGRNRVVCAGRQN